MKIAVRPDIMTAKRICLMGLMKKRIHRVLALLLALLTLALAALSCSAGKKVMELGGQSMSLNMYEFFLSRQKGILSTTYYYGSQAKNDDFWNTTISQDGTTNNEFWTSHILQSMKAYLAALYLFEEEYKLKLPAAATKEIDDRIAELLDYDADGSRSAFNALLSQFGINQKMLREIYIIEAKINYLQEYLYGANLSKVSAEVKEEYYQENYVRFKQVFLANYKYVYRTDDDGNVIYYDPDSEDDVILYDSSTGIRKFEDGRALVDKNGKVIYYHEDGSVAYDEKNGKPAIVYDENGNFMTTPYSAEELREIYKNAEEIVEFTPEGDTLAFEALIEEYGEDESLVDYPNGYYFQTGSKYSYDYINDIVASLSEMRVGQINIVESDYGYHVIMKYKLDPGGYADTGNAEWFEDFNTSVAQWLFAKKCEEYIDRIVVDQQLAGSIAIIDVAPNYNY